MTNYFTQVIFVNWVSTQKLIEQQINSLRMDPRLLTDARSIVGNDHRNRHAQSKGWIVKPIIQSRGKRCRGHQGRMRTGHSTGGQKEGPIPFMRTQKIQWNFDNLSKRPRTESCDEYFVLEQG